jgi:hypothetical protein
VYEWFYACFDIGKVAYIIWISHFAVLFTLLLAAGGGQAGIDYQIAFGVV